VAHLVSYVKGSRAQLDHCRTPERVAMPLTGYRRKPVLTDCRDRVTSTFALRAMVDTLRVMLARGLPTVAASEASAWRRLAEGESA
jgi:hypothetical protein